MAFFDFLTSLRLIILVPLILVDVTAVQEVGNCEIKRSPSDALLYQWPQYPRDCPEIKDGCLSDNSERLVHIKPNGYDQPFKVVCQDDVNGGTWTLIQRRTDSLINFNRSWSDYKDGFGFPNGDFWIGNRKLSFLTQQKKYQLRIQIDTLNGSSFYISYEGFRISDELSKFRLISLGPYNGITGCESHNTEDSVCYCQEGIKDSGQGCLQYTDCYDIYNHGLNVSKEYYIKPTDWPGSAFEVYCDMSNGGGWTVFQRRQDGSVDFNRDWNSYKNGFPDTAAGELWLGNEKLFYLTNQGIYKMRIELVNRDNVSYNLNYDAFRIGNENDSYELETLGTFTGNTGYDYMRYHLSRSFSTPENDNDDSSRKCASLYGAWWHGDCYSANLNGNYESNSDDGVALYRRGGGPSQYSLRFTEMKIRPV